MLKYRLPDLAGIPREVAAHYEPADDGSFVLRVEGMVAKTRLDEFRDNNVALAIERDRLAKALSEDGRTDEIERLVAERTAEMQRRLNRTLVERSITELAAGRHVRQEAFPDVIRRAQSLWSVGDDGGRAPAISDQDYDGAERPESPESWLDSLRTTAPHLFEASVGGGAPGGSTSDGGAVRVRCKGDLRTPKEKSDYIAKHGYDALVKLPLTAR